MSARITNDIDIDIDSLFDVTVEEGGPNTGTVTLHAKTPVGGGHYRYIAIRLGPEALRQMGTELREWSASWGGGA